MSRVPGNTHPRYIYRPQEYYPFAHPLIYGNLRSKGVPYVNNAGARCSMRWYRRSRGASTHPAFPHPLSPAYRTFLVDGVTGLSTPCWTCTSSPPLALS